MYDVVIVGAGPAGAMLARLIGEHKKVLLIDRRRLLHEPDGETFEKCCGGLIAPDAQQMLAILGLGIPKEVLVGPQLFTVRTMDFNNKIERYYQRNYINIDREAFDRWLVSLVPGKVESKFGALYKSHYTFDGKVKVTYMYEGSEHAVETRILVGADGAGSKVRKHAFPGQIAPELYVSIQEWFKVENSLPYFSSIFDEEITDYYSWTIPKGDSLLVGTAIPYAGDAWSKFELLKKKLSGFGFKLDAKLKTKGALVYRPKRTCQICTGNRSIALVGEAAGWISPSSAEGVSYSFRSALALAKSMEEGLNGFSERYKKNTTALKANIIIKNLKSPFMYEPKLRKLAMMSGLLAIKPINNDRRLLD